MLYINYISVKLDIFFKKREAGDYPPDRRHFVTYTPLKFVHNTLVYEIENFSPNYVMMYIP